MEAGREPGLAPKPTRVDAAAYDRRAAAPDAGLIAVLARLAGAAGAEAGAQALLAGLREAFGPGFAGRVAIAGPRLDVIATLEGPPGNGHRAPLTVAWADGARELAELTAYGLATEQAEALLEWAAWLQPAMARLADARAAGVEAARERRRALAWRVRAEVLALSQDATDAEAYLKKVVARVARQLRALHVGFWRYDAATASLRPAHASSDRLDLPVPPAVVHEVVATRRARTVALPDRGGSMRTCVLAPAFEGDALVGVFQVVPRRPAIDPGVEEATAAVAAAAMVGLRTIAAFARLTFQASHDPLTGLANRRTFEAFLDRELKLAERHGAPLSVLVVDADRFKAYNDTYGHAAGDLLLKALAGRLAQVVRSTDVVARYGGEEFVVVLPHTDKAGALAAAQKVLEGVRGLGAHPDVRGGRFTASVGVATYPEDVFDARELFNAADAALYRAKHLGRDQVCQAGD